MLTTRLRKQIEWHFYNYKADLRLYEERVQDIIDSGLTSKLSFAGRTSLPSSPTENKAMRIESLEHEKNWATVVRNTFDAFRFEPEYDVMVAIYIRGKSRNQIIMGEIWETTFFRWREKWIERAYRWAKEYRLI